MGSSGISQAVPLTSTGYGGGVAVTVGDLTTTSTSSVGSSRGAEGLLGGGGLPLSSTRELTAAHLRSISLQGGSGSSSLLLHSTLMSSLGMQDTTTTSQHDATTTQGGDAGSSTGGRSLTTSLLGSSHGSDISSHGSPGGGGSVVVSPQSSVCSVSSSTPSLLAAKSSRLMFPRAAFPVRADHAAVAHHHRPHLSTIGRQAAPAGGSNSRGAVEEAGSGERLPAPMSVSSWVGTSASRTPRDSSDDSSVGSTRSRASNSRGGARGGGGGAFSPSRW